MNTKHKVTDPMVIMTKQLQTISDQKETIAQSILTISELRDRVAALEGEIEETPVIEQEYKSMKRRKEMWKAMARQLIYEMKGDD